MWLNETITFKNGITSDCSMNSIKSKRNWIRCSFFCWQCDETSFGGIIGNELIAVIGDLWIVSEKSKWNLLHFSSLFGCMFSNWKVVETVIFLSTISTTQVLYFDLMQCDIVYFFDKSQVHIPATVTVIHNTHF